jgi:type III secretion protein U
MAEKTEQPTPRRLKKAREDGEAAVSSALSQSVGFLAGLAVLPAAVGSIVESFAGLVRLGARGQTPSAEACVLGVLQMSLPLLAVVAFSSAALSFSQTGGLFAPGRLTPKLERLSVLSGFRSLVSAPRLFGLLRSLIASAVLGLFTWLVLRSSLAALGGNAGELRVAGGIAAQAARKLALYAALVSVSLGVVDLIFVRRAWLRRLRMTRDEVRREQRESDGDPELKSARKRAHHEMLVSASVHAVKEASVVIVNPTHLATALRYDEREAEAPRVLAHGDGDLARRMIEAAHAYGVPVVRDVPLARALADLEEGQEIPEILYEAVAEVLRTLYDAEQQSPARIAE